MKLIAIGRCPSGRCLPLGEGSALARSQQDQFFGDEGRGIFAGIGVEERQFVAVLIDDAGIFPLYAHQPDGLIEHLAHGALHLGTRRPQYAVGLVAEGYAALHGLLKVTLALEQNVLGKALLTLQKLGKLTLEGQFAVGNLLVVALAQLLHPHLHSPIFGHGVQQRIITDVAEAQGRRRRHHHRGRHGVGNGHGAAVALRRRLNAEAQKGQSNKKKVFGHDEILLEKARRRRGQCLRTIGRCKCTTYFSVSRKTLGTKTITQKKTPNNLAVPKEVRNFAAANTAYYHILTSLHIMYLDSEKKQEIFGKYGTSNTDTGSAESQVALFSYRIAHLTEHMKANRKDHTTERALVALVGKRRALLNYLKHKDIERYRAIVKALGLRK